MFILPQCLLFRNLQKEFHRVEAYAAGLLKNENYMRLRPPLILSVPDAVTSWALNRRCHCAFFIFLFLLKINKRTVPALTCPYNYRHRMMIILFLLQAWHGYRWNSSCRKSVFQVCRDRLYVFDSGRFSWNLFLNCDSGFAFLFWTEAPFFSKKEDCLKKTALSDHFLRILIDKLGPYMCYVLFILHIVHIFYFFY